MQALRAAKNQDREAMEQQLSAIPRRAAHYEWSHAIRALFELNDIAGILEASRARSTLGGSVTLPSSAASVVAQAQREFAAALTVRASNSDVLYLKAYGHLLAGQTDEGVKSAKEAVWYGRARLFPISELHYLQAVGLAQQARLDEALKSLELASSGQPSAFAAVGLSSLALARGDKPAAIRAARAAVSSHPDHFHANMQLVRSLIYKADRLLDRSAIAEADKLSASLLSGLTPEQHRFREALEVRTRALIAAEKPQDAEALLIPVLSSTSTPDPLYQQLAAQVRVERLALEARQSGTETS
jgi:tetratricopeptide (TPR) repeat protein